MTYFEKLSLLINHNELKLILLIGVPRSSSTLVSKIISSSESVLCNIHEPYIHLGYSEKDPEFVYKEIYQEILAHLKDSKGKKYIVIKEMSYWFTFGDECYRLINAFQPQIIFLIRNPYLCIESRIKTVVKSIDLAVRESTIQYLSEHFNYDRISSSLNDSRLQAFLLKRYGKEKGYVSWNEFILDKIKKRDLREFSEILNFDTHRFRPSHTGWKEIKYLIEIAERKNLNFTIVDSAEVRTDPEGIFKKLCTIVNIKYRQDMLSWNKEKLSASHQTRKQDLIWYETLYCSTSVEPPLEVININNLPTKVVKQIINQDLEIYTRICNHKHRLKLDLKNDLSFSILRYIQLIKNHLTKPLLRGEALQKREASGQVLKDSSYGY